MPAVTISSKFQIVIPKEIRKNLGLEPGQKLLAFVFEDRIELVPLRPIRKERGFLKGIQTDIRREEDLG